MVDHQANPHGSDPMKFRGFLYALAKFLGDMEKYVRLSDLTDPFERS